MWIFVAVLVFALSSLAQAQEEPKDAEDFVLEFQDPLTNIHNFSMQNDFDFGNRSKRDRFANKLELQAAVPFKIHRSFEILTRTLMPVRYRDSRSETRLDWATLL